MNGERRTFLGGALVLVLLAVFVAWNAHVETDIGHFLPGGERDVEVALAKELSLGELSRTTVLLLDAGDTDRAVAAAEVFESELRAEPRTAEHLAFLEAGPAEGLEEALWQLYQPRRFAFFAEDPETTTQLLGEEALRAAAADLKQKLSLPLSTLVSRVAPEDPTLILPRLFQRLSGRGEGLRIVGDRFITEDGHGAILFLGARASVTPAAAQRSFQEGIAAAFQKTREAVPGELTLSQSGVGRFALRAEESMKADIQRVSIGSMLGLLLFFLVLFRSLRLFVMVLPVISAGFLAGTSACLLAFGSVHGITLAFGAAMIGVSIDYAVHFQGHWTLAPDPGGPRATFHHLWRGLALSAATTVTGFLALGASDFPGLSQMGLFAAVGVAAALFASRAFLPAMAARSEPKEAARRLARLLGRLLAQPRSRLAAAPALVLGFALVGLPRLEWNDNIADMNRLDPELLAEDEAVRARVVRYEQRRIVVALGKDEEAALAVNERIARRLAQAADEGLLESYRTLATLLPSAETQRTIDALVRNDGELWPRLETALAAEGFRTESFQGFREALAAPAPEPLLYDELLSSPLASLVRAHRVRFAPNTGIENARVGFVSFLNGLHDEERLRTLLDDLPGAHLIDVQATLTHAYGGFRRGMQTLLLVGLAAVFVLIFARHRALRPTLAVYLPAVLAAAGTLGLLSLIGVNLNMLSLVALLMVVCMGVDYGVLLVENRNDPRAFEATLFAVFVAGVSTLLGFGLLAFSRQPALNAIGWSAGTGVLLCLVLAPVLCAGFGLAPGREIDSASED